jgi:hypothetical protein
MNSPLSLAKGPMGFGKRPLFFSKRPFSLGRGPLPPGKRPFFRGRGQLPRSIGPLLLGRGPLLGGGAPLSLGRGPLLVGKGSFLVGRGPFPRGRGTLSSSEGPLLAGEGPLPFQNGPFLVCRGRLPLVIGPLLLDSRLWLDVKGPFPKDKWPFPQDKGLFPKTNGLSLGSKPLRLESKTVFVESERPVPKRSALSKRTADRSAVNLIASIWLSAHGAISFARGRRFFERRSGTRLGRPRISIILGRLSDAPPISTRRQPELAAEGHAEKRGVREATQRDRWAPDPRSYGQEPDATGQARINRQSASQMGEDSYDDGLSAILADARRLRPARRMHLTVRRCAALR